MPATLKTDYTISLSEEERKELLEFLENAVRETLVEVHRTESSDFRALVEHKLNAMQSVVQQLKKR